MCLPLLTVGHQHRLDHILHFAGGKRRTDDTPGRGLARQRGAIRATQGHLVPLLAVLIDAQNADVAAVVVAAAVDAAADVKVHRPDVVQLIEVLVTRQDLLRQGQGARVGQITKVATGARNHVGEQTDVGTRQAQGLRLAPDIDQLIVGHPRQDQVLLVAHASFTQRKTLCQIGGLRQLNGRGVPRRVTGAFERQADGAQSGVGVQSHVALDPALKSWALGIAQRRSAGRRGFQRGGHKKRAHASQLGLRNGVGRAVDGNDVAVLGLDLVHKGLPFGLDQDLDAGFVDVVAAAKAVVGANNGFQVVEDLVPGQKIADHRADEGRAAHAAAHAHLKTQVARGVAQQAQAHVVPRRGGAVFGRTGDGHLEFARQKRELGVQGAPLAHDFCEWARVGHLVGCDTGQGIGGDVADAIARGLDAVHVDLGQEVHHVGRTRQGNPVELHVLARGEVAATVGQGRDFAQARVGLAGVVVFLVVEVAGDASQGAQLRAADFAVRHGHAQHGRETLDVPAVLQTQGFEFGLQQFARLPAGQLVTELGGALEHQLAVKIVVLVHGGGSRYPEEPGFSKPQPIWQTTFLSYAYDFWL